MEGDSRQTQAGDSVPGDFTVIEPANADHTCLLQQILAKLDQQESRLTSMEKQLVELSSRTVDTLQEDKTYMRDRLSDAQSQIMSMLKEILDKVVQMQKHENPEMFGRLESQIQAVSRSRSVSPGYAGDTRRKSTRTSEQSLSEQMQDTRADILSAIGELSSMRSNRTEKNQDKENELIELTKQLRDCLQGLLDDSWERLEAEKKFLQNQLYTLLSDVVLKVEQLSVGDNQHQKTLRKEQADIKKAAKETLDTLSKFKEEHKEQFSALGKAMDTSNHMILEAQGVVEGAIGKTNAELHEALVNTQKDIANFNENTSFQVQETARKIFQFVEREAQITRFQQRWNRKPSPSYTCDFYVRGFRHCLRSGRTVYSMPWHIEQFDTCLVGKAMFKTDGSVEVRLNLGRRPLEVGLKPTELMKFSYNVSIMADTDGERNWHLKEGRADWKESSVEYYRDFGIEIATLSQKDLIQTGYHNKDILILRYRFIVG